LNRALRIPEKLDSGAEQQKRRESDDNNHPGGAKYVGTPISEAVATIDAANDQQGPTRPPMRKTG